MKRMMVFLFVAALMLVPMGATASMQSISDSDMAAVTGQAGVDITINTVGKIGIGLKSITWGDPDGLDGTVNVDQGFVNLSVPTGLVTHVGIPDLVLAIDVGDSINGAGVGETVAQIKIKPSYVTNPAYGTTSFEPYLPIITLDAFMVGIFFDSHNAVGQDYAFLNGDFLAAGEYATWAPRMDVNLRDLPAALNSKCVGVFGLSGLEVYLTGDITLQISAH
jgi:hypothetical protein